MGSQTLELKWANHKSNMISELQELYSSDTLFDVTIACGENSVKAHKTVLSASSTFFRKLFIDNPCQHPILIMTDVDFGDVKTIVEFMYQGEIHISREKLTQFLKIADRLKVKGLTNIENINLNPPEDYETADVPQYPSDTTEQAQNQPQLRDTTAQSSSSNPADSVQNNVNKDIPVIKLEDDEPTDNGSCMYWQSECFDQTSSSSIVPEYSLSSPSTSHQQLVSTAPHQLSSSSISHSLLGPSVSRQLPAASVSHQLSLPSASHQLVAPSVPSKATEPSSSHQLGVPLNDEGFTYSDKQTDNTGLSQMQEESTGSNINPQNLYLSQDQTSIAVPPSTKPSFETVESLSSHSSSQDGKADKCAFSDGCSERRDVLFRTEENNADRRFSYEKCKPYKFYCRICKKSFPSQQMFADHETCYHKLGRFICDICCKSCSSKWSLQRHQRMHTGEKPFQCKMCHKKYLQYCDLQYHERTHTGEKPFQCKRCNKQFFSKGGLQYHERTHTRKMT